MPGDDRARVGRPAAIMPQNGTSATAKILDNESGRLTATAGHFIAGQDLPQLRAKIEKVEGEPMKAADDLRVSAARRLLATPCQPDAMGADALRRLLAKYRRHVTRLLAAIADQPAPSAAGPDAAGPDAAATLGRDDLMTVLGALHDAARYRSLRMADCALCTPGRQCERHAADAAVAARYRALASALGDYRERQAHVS